MKHAIRAAMLLLGAMPALSQEPKDSEVFPIAVWLQNPRHAERYKAIGINTYVGLWRGPTDAQLDALKAAGLRVVCSQNEVGLRRKDDPVILAWMHGDEPDNAQAKRGGGYGPPVPPERIVAGYRRMKERDPSRPVFLNLGQGVAWDQWVGRGARTNHPEDYPEYVKGCDIASFDIYPAVHEHAAVAGKLWYVGRGVKRLRKWAGSDRIVWNAIEASRISNVKTKPTVDQIRAEVWMSIIHGSTGIIYFVHQFKPRFIEASLLRDEVLLQGVKKINAEIQRLAPVLLSPAAANAVQVRPSDEKVPVAFTVRRHGGATYVFAVGMRGKATSATFTLSEGRSAASVEVLGEGRTIPVRNGAFEDRVGAYGVRLYRIEP